MKVNGCLVCDRISKIKSGDNPYFVKELKTGYVVLGDYQFYRGYTLFLFKDHLTELSDIDDNIRQEFLREMSIVAEAVKNAFSPNKLNYELLGNSHAHMHWHIFPRHKDDPMPKVSIWELDKSIRCNDNVRLNEEQRSLMKENLLKHIELLI